VCQQDSDPAVLQLQLTVAAELLLVLERIPFESFARNQMHSFQLTVLSLSKENGMMFTIEMKLSLHIFTTYYGK
jgi:hypothetical protein